MIRWKMSQDGQVTGEYPIHDPEVRRVLRETFTSREGRQALTIILSDLGFFDELRDQRSGEPLTGEALVRATALRDYARRLLEQLGALHEANVATLVDKMLDLPVWEKQNKRRRNGRSE